MKRISRLGALLLIAAAGSLAGAQPNDAPNKPAAATAAASQPPNDNDRPVVSKWTLKFETSQEPLRLAVDSANSRLVDRRYVAEFAVDEPPSFVRHSIPSNYSNFSLFDLAAEHLHEIVGDMPESRRPPKEAFDEVVRCTTISWGDPLPSTGHTRIDYQVFAPTAERAQELVQTILSIYGSGISVPNQEKCQDNIKEDREELSRYRKLLPKAEADLADFKKELESLKGYVDVDEKSLATFTEKRRMVDVDMVETKARIDACDKVLSQKDIPLVTPLDRVRAIQITAQIELNGQQAKRAAVEKILKDGARRLALLNLVDYKTAEVADEKKKIPDDEAAIPEFIVSRKAWEACPIAGGKVVIRPLKWEPPKEAPKAQSTPNSWYPPGYAPAPTDWGYPPNPTSYPPAAPNPR